MRSSVKVILAVGVLAGCSEVLGAGDLEYTLPPKGAGAQSQAAGGDGEAGAAGKADEPFAPGAGSGGESPGERGGAGGAGGAQAGTAGTPGSGGESCEPDAAPALEGCCVEQGALACQGNAQKVALICHDGFWQLSGACDSNQNCDSVTGACSDLDARCEGRVANETFCVGATYIACGPDLVSAEDQTCTGQCTTSGCVAVCGNGVREQPELCDDGNDLAGDGCSPDCRYEAVQLSLGSAFTCALMSSGEVKCWGQGGNGRLGNGNDERSLTPVNANLSAPAKSINMGAFHGCAVLLSGVVECWGYNEYGELGTGDKVDRLDPVGVNIGAGKARGLAGGRLHNCALTTDNAVFCWGNNSHGQLGTGDFDERLTPAPVLGLAADVISIAAGDEFTCALLSTGDVQCWGDNGQGQLGNDNAPVDASVPVDVMLGGKAAKSVTTGRRHACAGHADGSISCWGANASGQLGYPTITQSDVPVVSAASGDPATLVAFKAHTCVVSDGQAVCWGDNAYGQLGIDTNVGGATPVTALLSEEPRELAGGFLANYTCALTASGSVLCWGYNEAGNLGTNDLLTRGDEAGEMATLVPVPL